MLVCSLWVWFFVFVLWSFGACGVCVRSRFGYLGRF